MAKKNKYSYNEIRDSKEDWGLDDRNNKPYSGQSVQEFIKGNRGGLKSKAGCFYYDPTNNRYIVFADEENRDKYLENTTLTELIIGTFDAPFNYNAVIEYGGDFYKAISLGSTGNYLDFSFRIENKNGSPTGENVQCTYTFRNNSIVKTVIEQYSAGRNIHFNIDKYLLSGTNNITIAIQGVDSLAATTIGITYRVVDLQLTTDIDLSKVYNLNNGNNTIIVDYSVKGDGNKIIEYFIDGIQLDFVKSEDEIVNTSGYGFKYIVLNSLGDGNHSLQIKVKTTVDGSLFESDIHYYSFIINNGNLQTPCISYKNIIPIQYGILSESIIYGLTQYVPYNLEFAVYHPNKNNNNINILLDDKSVAQMIVKNYEEVNLNIVPINSGNSKLKFEIDNYEIILDLVVNNKIINIDEIKNNLIFDFSAVGKNNNAADKANWSYDKYTGQLSGFDWNNNSGWIDNVLKINNGAKFDVNYSPLEENVTNVGFTFEIEFAVTNVTSIEDTVLDLTDEVGTGLLITSKNITLKSKGKSEITTSYKEDQFIRLSVVINRNKNVANKCLSFFYINGVCSRACNWDVNDTYKAIKNISFIGTSNVEILLKYIRVYNTALSSDQILNNFNLYQTDIDKMNEIYDRNDIYLEDGSGFDYEKMMNRLPVVIITGDVPMLENTTDKNLQIVVDVDYYNIQDPTKSFKMISAALRPQGTSSMGYPKKNFRLYSNVLDSTIFYDYLNNIIKDRKYAFKPGSIPVDCWCFKADFAESSGTHNTGVARLWNEVIKNAMIDGEYLLRTNAQNAALLNEYSYDVRTAIDGFPCLMFYRLTKNDPLIFIGKYNFNNDKSTENVFGFCDIPGFDNSKMQCWEVLNNGNDIGLFKRSDNFYNYDEIKGEYEWQKAVESRYPDIKNPDTTSLKTFCDWIVNVTQEDFTTQKWEHLDVHKMASYWVYLNRFAAADQWVKNAMFTSEDGIHFYYIIYDNDTINGLINNGYLAVPPLADRHTLNSNGEPYFAGKESRLWNLIEKDEEFMRLVRKVDNALYSAGLDYQNVINMFDNEQSAKWVERVYNQDAQYKYIGPYIEKGINNLFMLQGSRAEHRKYWLAERFNYLDSKYVSGAYKANVIEFKCLDNTPSGQQFSIVAGANLDYGYGINNVEKSINNYLLIGESITFTTIDNLNLGDPVRIYGATSLEEVDLSLLMDRLSILNISNIYKENFGTKLKRLFIGNVNKENTSLESIGGISEAIKLEELDIQNMKAITSLDLSNLYNLKKLNASGSGLTGVTFAVGGLLEEYITSDVITTISLNQLNKLSNVEFNKKSVVKIDIKQCPSLSHNFNIVKNWITNNTVLQELIMTDIEWNVTYDDLILISNILNKDLTGVAKLNSITEEQFNSIVDLYGEEVFNKSNKFYIKVPDGIYLFNMGTLVVESEYQLNPIIVSDSNNGVIQYSVLSGINQVTIDENGLMTIRPNASNTVLKTIQIEIKYIPTQGNVLSNRFTFNVEKAYRITQGIIIGDEGINKPTKYKLEVKSKDGNYLYSPNKPFNTIWSVEGDNIENINVIKIDNTNCEISFNGSVPFGEFTLKAIVINDNDTEVVITKVIKTGLTLKVNTIDDATNEFPTISISTLKFVLQINDEDPIEVAFNTNIAVPQNSKILLYFIPKRLYYSDNYIIFPKQYKYEFIATDNIIIDYKLIFAPDEYSIVDKNGKWWFLSEWTGSNEDISGIMRTTYLYNSNLGYELKSYIIDLFEYKGKWLIEDVFDYYFQNSITGKDVTDEIINNFKNNAEIANYCKNYIFKHGINGFLPTLNELSFFSIDSGATTLNYLLAEYNGDSINLYDGCWASNFIYVDNKIKAYAIVRINDNTTSSSSKEPTLEYPYRIMCKGIFNHNAGM